MNKDLKIILEAAARCSNDLWKETNVAAQILLQGGYEGYQDDLQALEDVRDCTEFENLLSRGSWYFQETDKWNEKVM